MRKKKASPVHFRKLTHRQGQELIRLMKLDVIPYQWASIVFNLWKACHAVATKCDEAVARNDEKYLESQEAHDMGYFQNVLMAQIQKIEWYITNVRKRIKAHGSTIRQVVAKAKAGKNAAMFTLLQADQRWLSEKWVQLQLVNKSSEGDGQFFIQLGGAIANQKKKVLSRPYGGKNEELIKKLYKMKGPFASLQKIGESMPMLEDRLRLLGVIDDPKAKLKPANFKKLLQRHNLISPIQNRLLS